MADDTNIVSEPSNNPQSSSAATESPTTITASLNQLTVEVAELRKEVKEKDDIISQLHKHIHWVETEMPSHNKKRRFSNSEQIEHEDEGMKNLKIENERLNKWHS